MAGERQEQMEMDLEDRVEQLERTVAEIVAERNEARHQSRCLETALAACAAIIQSSLACDAEVRPALRGLPTS